MTRLIRWGTPWVIAAWLGMFLPGLPPCALAAPPLANGTGSLNDSSTNSAAGPHRLVRQDIVLGADGTLRGVTIDGSGKAVRRVPVVLMKGGAAIARNTTSESGQFTFRSLRGGVYQIKSAGKSVVFRLWAARTGPPQARGRVVVVVPTTVVRGQRPSGRRFTSDAILLGTVIAAGGVIPVVVDSNQTNYPPGS